MSTPPPWPPPPPPSPPGEAVGRPPVAIARPAKASAAVPLAIILVVLFFGGVVVLGIVAAIAIPGFLRARMSANEAAAIGAMRTMVSAQAAWASAHAGQYAPPSCLGEPASCGEATESLLAAEAASLGTSRGYAFAFVLRPAARAAAQPGETPGGSAAGEPSDAEVRAQLEQFSTPDTGALGADASAPATTHEPGGFAYWATPSTPGASGNRRFCADETGTILEYAIDAEWTPPTDAQPRCPETGRPLQ